MTETIMGIRKKIESYKDAFCKNEMMVRYALVDPFLREIGWDLSDPRTVMPEESLVKGAGTTDYTMFGSTQTHLLLRTADAVFPYTPVMVVEVKSLGSHLDSKAIKVVNYMETRKTQYGVLTDGRKWRFYYMDSFTKTEEQRQRQRRLEAATQHLYGRAKLNDQVQFLEYIRMDGTSGEYLVAEFDIMDDSMKKIVMTAAKFGRDAIYKNAKVSSVKATDG